MYTLTSALLAAVAIAGSAKYEQNGADWGDLCKYGKEQSPIDLTMGGATDNGNMELVGYNYYDFKVKTGSGGFSDADYSKTIPFDTDALRKAAELELTFADGSQSYFQPLQFHFHAPSEHTVDGKNMDLEIHFVHTVRGSDTAGNTAAPQAEMAGAVIGVFFDREAGGNYDNAFLDTVDKAIITKGTASATTVGVRDFLSRMDMSQYWSYDGSLTTPPCTEGLKWSVVKQVQPISEAQLLKFTSKLAGDQNFAKGKGNNRVTMPLNDRTLYMAAATSGATYTAATLSAAALALAALSF